MSAPAPSRATPLNVVLIGFMGCGKSTAGPRLALQLGFEFVDTDALIIKAAKCSIPKIFESEGETGFRARESAVLEALAGRERTVIATGGGIVTVPDNIPRLRALGFVIWLNPPEDTIWQRISRNKSRPLLRTADPRQTMRDLLAARRPLYAAASDMEAEMQGLTPDECAWGLAESVRMHFSTGARNSGP